MRIGARLYKGDQTRRRLSKNGEKATLKEQMGENVVGGGRPDKAKIVEEWRTAHPEGTPKDCIADTGISKNTVYKWWSVGEAL